MATTMATTPSPSPPPSPKYEVLSPGLPIELILQIIQSIVPSPTSLLRVSDPHTKLLVSFTRVSRFTYRPSSILLRRHCASIESQRALGRFFLTQDRSPTFHADLSWWNITSLYLAPFTESIPESVATVLIPALLSRLSQTLRVLVIDIHFVTAPDGLSKNYVLVPKLREAISRLKKLEEFVCLECPILDDTHDLIIMLILRELPKLKRLLLFNFPADRSWWWRHIAKSPHLEFVWIVDPKNRTEDAIDVVVADAYSELHQSDGALLKRRYTVAVAGCPQQTYPKDGWAHLDPEVYTKFRFLGRRGSADPGKVIRRVVGHIERGTLWDLDAVEAAGGL